MLWKDFRIRELSRILSSELSGVNYIFHECNSPIEISSSQKTMIVNDLNNKEFNEFANEQERIFYIFFQNNSMVNNIQINSLFILFS